jgi:outer membrane protein assembly factor BamB
MARGDAANTGVAVGPGPAGPASARWTFDERFVAGKAPVVADDTVYVGTAEDEPGLVALEAATGDETWRTTLEDTRGFPDSSPAVAGDLVLAPFGGLVVGADAATGEVRWRLRPGDGVTGPVVADGTAYLAVAPGGTVLALDPASGEVDWERSVGDQVTGSVAVADGTVYAVAATGESGSLVALEAATGERRWAVDLDGSPETRPAVADGSVYLAQQGALRAFSTDGTPVFRVDLRTTEEAAIRYSRGGSAPAVAHGSVYFGAPDGHVYAVDAATGEREWSFWTWGGVSGDPVVAGDTVYVVSDDTFVYALDAADGTRRWEFDTAGHPDGAGGAVVGDLLFVATEGNGLLALEGP